MPLDTKKILLLSTVFLVMMSSLTDASPQQDVDARRRFFWNRPPNRGPNRFRPLSLGDRNQDRSDKDDTAIVFEDEAEKQSAGSGSGDKSPAGPPTRPQVGPVASLLGFGRPVARPPTRPAPRPVTRPVARPPAPAGPAGPDGGDNTSTAIGGGSASANNGNAQATGQAIAQAPPGGIALSIGTSIALSTPFGNHAISLGNGIAVGRK